ncbi:uncharacterized protein AMSG_11628, partial [Thecamonas trahens ATCC 50062]
GQPAHGRPSMTCLLSRLSSSRLYQDSGLLAGALHGAVALDAVPETHYCREMWKATRGIGRFDGDGSQWCTAALSALVGIPLDTRLEVQLDPSPKASLSPPTTPPK